MYVCHCRAVTDQAVKAAVDAGVRSIDELERTCGAGSECGGCHPLLAELLGCTDRELIGASTRTT